MQSTQEAIAELTAARTQIEQSLRSGREIANKHLKILDAGIELYEGVNLSANEILGCINIAQRRYQERKLKPEFQP